MTEDVEKLRFNRCIAHIYELANALSDAIGDVTSPQALTPDLRLGLARGRQTFWCSSSIR